MVLLNSTFVVKTWVSVVFAYGGIALMLALITACIAHIVYATRAAHFYGRQMPPKGYWQPQKPPPGPGYDPRRPSQ